MQICPYLSFAGTCEEAFGFYAHCFGGKVGELFRYAGTPLADQVPADWHNKVMHGSVTLANLVVMGADAAAAHYNVPAGFSLSVHLADVSEAERIFHELSAGGRIVMPLAPTFWAARFGVLVDRFAIHWSINCGEPSS